MDIATITGILVAAGGFLGVIASVVIFRVTKRTADIEKIKKEAVDSSSLTLESWTRLNKALQDEVDRLQRRVNQLEAAMEEMRTRLPGYDNDPHHA